MLLNCLIYLRQLFQKYSMHVLSLFTVTAAVTSAVAFAAPVSNTEFSSPSLNAAALSNAASVPNTSTEAESEPIEMNETVPAEADNTNSSENEDDAASNEPAEVDNEGESTSSEPNADDNISSDTNPDENKSTEADEAEDASAASNPNQANIAGEYGGYGDYGYGSYGRGGRHHGVRYYKKKSDKRRRRVLLRKKTEEGSEKSASEKYGMWLLFKFRNHKKLFGLELRWIYGVEFKTW